ncbi:hypothetical protein Anas_01555 [Armadillidium nasatum]|uniref:Uncharacterized protein n=1 Tax=Armadillidium nasatum TaxID=96803 RepID=A0A5N5SUV2_9CRUS|nr:hypothetical protein Anas_01555 [Armadillidium nasatum]
MPAAKVCHMSPRNKENGTPPTEIQKESEKGLMHSHLYEKKKVPMKKSFITSTMTPNGSKRSA